MDVVRRTHEEVELQIYFHETVVEGFKEVRLGFELDLRFVEHNAWVFYVNKPLS